MSRNKAPNYALRYQRERRNWTQEQAAEALLNLCGPGHRGEVNAQMISKWERGAQTPNFEHRERLCELYGVASPEELGFLRREEPKVESLVRIETNIAVSEFSDEAANIALQGRLRQALKKSSPIDKAIVDYLEIVVNDCWKMIPVVAGVVSYHSRAYILERLEMVTNLLERPQSTLLRKRLCSIASELSLIVANISSNLREYYIAKMYYEVSIDAAREASNSILQAVSLVRLSFNSTRNGQADVALPLVQEASHLIAQDNVHATAKTSAWIASATAEVYANLQDPLACFKVLEQAERYADGDNSGEDPYYTTFSPSLFFGYKGACYRLLQRSNDAERVLEIALRQFGSAPTYQKGYLLNDIARVCIQQGKIEEASEYAKDALVVALQTKSPEVFQLTCKLRKDLDTWASTSSVQSLEDQIRLSEHRFRGKKEH